MAKKKWLCKKDCFGQVDGQWQRLKADEVYIGDVVHPECDFTLLDAELSEPVNEPTSEPEVRQANDQPKTKQVIPKKKRKRRKKADKGK